MSDTDTLHVSDVLQLASIERPTWPAISAKIRASGVPTCDGDDASAGEPAGGSDDDAPAGGSDDDANDPKWKALARKHEARAKANAAAAAKLKKLEDEGKTEIQRATDKAAEADARATKAESTALRLEVALDKAPDGMSLKRVRSLAKRLTGSTREELEEDAEELFGEFASDKGSDEPDDDEPTPRRRPKERLRSGAAPSAEPDETDPDKLAAKVPRLY